MASSSDFPAGPGSVDMDQLARVGMYPWRHPIPRAARAAMPRAATTSPSPTPPDVTDDRWSRCGVSVVWDAALLSQLGPLSKALPLLEWLRWQADGWPERSHDFTGHTCRAIIVAGLDAALAARPAAVATEWVRSELQGAIREFQANVAGGGGEAALIFWMPDRTRFVSGRADEPVYWRTNCGSGSTLLPLSQGIWNGVRADLARILAPGSLDVGMESGLFRQRVRGFTRGTG